MNARVKRAFRDKYTKKLYSAGEIVSVSDERFSEIMNAIGGEYIEQSEASANQKIRKAETVDGYWLDKTDEDRNHRARTRRN